MSGVIDLLVKEGFLFPIQIIIIVIDAYLFYSKKASIYIDISTLLILSTLVLQSLRRRFLLIHPQNLFVHRESSEIDTYYLRGVIVVSTFSALLGLLTAYNPELKSYMELGINRKGPEYIFSMFVAGIFLIGIIPCLFWLFGKYLNERVANKLKKLGPHISVMHCPRCNFPVIARHEIIKSDVGQKDYSCSNPECNYKINERISLNIGE